MAEATLLTCGRGHRWDGASSSVCPQCGAAAQVGGSPTLSADSLKDLQVGPNTDSGATLPQGGPARDALPRPTVPGFDVDYELGRGGMGVVYLARQRGLNRLIALKMILSGTHASPQERERFRIEAQAAARLQHPNIVQIYDVGEAEGRPYLALEYVSGGSLAAKLTGNPWPGREAARLIEPLARAIHVAHEHGIIHRDLKPANILLSERGPDGDHAPVLPKITDFGLAKQLHDATKPTDGAGPTRSGAVMGTPSYIAPEQASGRASGVGPAADVYSLGAILYETLTGRPPFRGETPLDTVLQVMTDDPVPPRQLQPKIARDLETICMKCLQKDPRRRYACAADLAKDLARFLNNEPILARPVSTVARMVKWARRKPALATLVAGGIVSVVVIVATSIGVSVALSAAAERERTQADNAKFQSGVAKAQMEQANRDRTEAERLRGIAEQEATLARRSLYALQLAQAATLSERDPERARQLLDDPARCPADLRDFTWGYLHRICRRERPPLAGHLITVSSVAFSNDGMWIASASWDRTLRIWAPALRADPWITQPAHDGLVLAMAISPDGSQLATCSDDRTIKLWSIERPLIFPVPGIGVVWPIPMVRERAVFQGHPGGVRAVAFSPDSKALASAGYDSVVKLWDVSRPFRRPPLIAVLEGHTQPIWSLGFSPDGKKLASGGNDRTIRLWDTSWLSPRKPAPKLIECDLLEGHTDGVVALAFAPDGKTLASGGNDRDQTLRLWDLARKKERGRLRGHTRAVFAIAFSADGQTLATGSGDWTIRLWDPTTGRERTVLQGHVAQIHALSFAGNGRWLASGGADRVIRVWDLQEHREETRQIDATRPGPVRVATDASSIAFADEAGVKLLALTPGVKPMLLGEHGRIELIAAAGGIAVACEPTGICRIWMDGKMVRQIPLQERVRSLTLSPDGTSIAVGTAKGALLLYAIASGERIARWPEAHKGPVTALAFSADGKTVATAGADRLVRTWRSGVDQPIQSITGAANEVRALAFSPRGPNLAGSTLAGSLEIWNSETGEHLHSLTGHSEAATALAFTPDGHTLATGSDDRTVKLWDASTGQERAALTGHPDHVVSLAFNANSTLLISASRDGTVKMWTADER